MRIIEKIAKMSWMTSALTPVAVILMEVLWVYSWLVWLGNGRPVVLNAHP